MYAQVIEYQLIKAQGDVKNRITHRLRLSRIADPDKVDDRIELLLCKPGKVICGMAPRQPRRCQPFRYLSRAACEQVQVCLILGRKRGDQVSRKLAGCSENRYSLHVDMSPRCLIGETAHPVSIRMPGADGIPLPRPS